MDVGYGGNCRIPNPNKNPKWQQDGYGICKIRKARQFSRAKSATWDF